MKRGDEAANSGVDQAVHCIRAVLEEDSLTQSGTFWFYRLFHTKHSLKGAMETAHNEPLLSDTVFEMV